MEITDPDKPSGYNFLGTDIFSIPCFRNSFMAGTITSTGVSLLTLLFSSSGKKVLNYSFGSFILATFPYMLYCQHDHFSTLEALEEVRQKISKASNNEMLVRDSLVDDERPDAIV